MDVHRHQWLTNVVIVGAPLLLAFVEWFHPHPHVLLQLDVRTWLAVHYLQIPLFPLNALAIALLVRGHADIAAAVCRVAMFVFAVSFIALDTAAGVVTGILVQAAQSSGDPDVWRPAIDAVWNHPIMGGSPLHAPVFAIMGSVALSVGTIAGAISLRLAGRSWPPVLLLAISGFGIAVFKTHAWPGGPVTFGCVAAAAAWLLWQNHRRKLRRDVG
ncbi:MAG: hypothetical protein ABI612_25745 [Betaproteobacteria bacterium]